MKKQRRIIDERVTGRDDHCTPKWFCELMAKYRPIDLDVAGTSNRRAPINKFARAKYLLSRGQDALILPWRKQGFVFCNPPYGTSVRLWAVKAVNAFAHLFDRELKGDELIMLVAARVDTRWFRYLWRHADAVVICRKRFEFIGEEHGAKFPQAVIYFGARRERFTKHFAHLGVILTTVSSQSLSMRSRTALIKFPDEDESWTSALTRYQQQKGKAA